MFSLDQLERSRGQSITAALITRGAPMNRAVHRGGAERVGRFPSRRGDGLPYAVRHCPSRTRQKAEWYSRSTRRPHPRSSIRQRRFPRSSSRAPSSFTCRESASSCHRTQGALARVAMADVQMVPWVPDGQANRFRTRRRRLPASCDPRTHLEHQPLHHARSAPLGSVGSELATLLASK